MAANVHKNDIQLSKMLSKMLRHSASEYGLHMDSNGYCVLDEVIEKASRLLRNPHITREKISDIVNNCPKQRFKMTTVDGVMKIRANQGHTLEQVKDMALKEILHFEDDVSGQIIHGTNYKAWSSIQHDGLNKMKRNHIHMARGELGHARSGARLNSEVVIVIDGNLAISHGIKFFESENGVILSSGDVNGTMLPKYFQKVFDRKSNKVLFPL